MFRSYLKLAIRNLIRNRIQSIIQILSLSIGLTVFSMICLYVYDEITVDRSSPGFKNIYRIEQPETLWSKDLISPALGSLFMEKHPEILGLARVNTSPNTFTSTKLENHETLKSVKIRKLIYVDSGFLELFPQEFIHGDPQTALKERKSIVLTESLANKLFGRENPMGKTVRNNLIVTGIIKDPLNTHLIFDAIGSFPPPNFEENKAEISTERGRFMYGRCATYIKLHKAADKAELEKKLQETWKELEESFNHESLASHKIYLDPLKQVHFTEIDPSRGYMARTDKGVLTVIFGLGLNLLFLGIVNYINLATARAERRKREVAIKRIVGSSRFQLIVYFLTESTLTVVVSFLIAATCLQLMFSGFNRLLQADINLYFLTYPEIWAIILLSVLFIGIISGIYPAFRISGGSALGYLSGGSNKLKREIMIRRLLMITQFTVAIIMIISVLSMQLQLRFMQRTHDGFLKNKIAWVTLHGLSNEKKSLLLTRLQKIPGVESACLSDKIPGKIEVNDVLFNRPEWIWYGYDIEWIFATQEFFEVYGLQLTHGQESLEYMNRLTPEQDSEDGPDNWIFFLNETGREFFELDDPVGYKLAEGSSLVGVFEDFHFQSLRYGVEPLVLIIRERFNSLGELSLKLSGENIHRTLRLVDDEINDIKNESGSNRPPREFEFLEDTFGQLYLEENRIQSASFYISVLSLMIACLGIFGLSTFIAQRRTKEIGIRKALGASDMQLFRLLSWDLIRWVILSVIIGSPIGWFIMNKWQQQFAYKADTGIWIYLVAAAVAFGISFLTSGWQAFKTARTNPVESLRYE